jgi:ribosomal-protein-alanine N-acetyltransferase
MISIRKLTIKDVSTTFAYSSDLENTYYMLNSPLSTIEEAKQFIDRCIDEYSNHHPKYLSFAVVYGQLHVGEVFATIDGSEAIIGWIIDKHYWGKGIATHAARLLIEHLKSEFQINYLISYCDARNFPSQRVMEKIGMTFVGTNGLRNYNKDVSPCEELKYEMHL